MSKVDDELTRRFHRAERPVETDDLVEELTRRRHRRRTLQRMQAGALAVAVVAATGAGFAVLTGLFDPDGRGPIGAGPYGASGAIVTCGDAAGQICRIDAGAIAHGPTGDDLVRLTDFSVGQITSLAVSSDGSSVVFERHEPGAETDRFETSELWTIGIDGKELRQLTEPGAGFIEPSWSPTGLLVAVASDGVSQEAGTAALAILDPSADAKPEVGRIDLPGLTFPSSPQWTPDGERILFSASAEPTTDLYTVAADGTHLTNITNSAETEYTPRLSPDGRSIAFWVGSPNGVEIRFCSLDCVDPRPLTDPDGRPIYGDFPEWSPDGNWITFQVTTGPGTDLHIARIDGSDQRVFLSGSGQIAWIPASTEGTTITPEPEPSSAPSPEPEGRDIGLGFNLCHTEHLSGIDFLGDGTRGTAWTGTKVKPNGTCPTNYDDRFGVAVDFTGDGVADSWSGETIAYCGGCEPLKAMDLNTDGREELLVVLDYFSIMHYGVYTVLAGGDEPQVVSFRVGEPGHPEHSLDAGKPFTFWVGGDAGLSDWFYCESLPTIWLTSTESPIDAKPGDVTTVHETEVSLGTDGVAHILYANTYTVSAEATPSLTHTTPDFSDPDCGMGVGPG